jgi:hypothetical protein
MFDRGEQDGHRFESVHQPSTGERMAFEFTGYCLDSKRPTVCSIAGLTGFGVRSIGP